MSSLDISENIMMKKYNNSKKATMEPVKALLKLTQIAFMNKAVGTKTGIKFEQVWRATKNYKIPEQWSTQKDCVIPKDTRIVV